jgi:glycosyltransferase involved in cell wall biosynthesis
VDGEARSILEEADAGIYYPAEDADGLVDAVVKLKTDPTAADRMGQNGRKYAVAHCTREEQSRIMTRFVQQICENRKERTDARA